ncbi:gamma-aminobutyric acid type B receptor subunit 2-like [Asterias amurensis]|uniref:gamma-aminobutyric acid type B receptor subunit 2-like n=1 Tax=Asterias amurensis TaxID=7602 RepID=UPI003AB8394E
MASCVSIALYFLLTIAFHFDELGEHHGTVEVLGDTIQRKPVYVGALLPTERDQIYDMLPTVQAAVDHVNELDGLLDDYELRIRWNLTERDPANALRIVNHFVNEGPPVSMVWGPVFSNVAVVVNEVIPRYNVIQVVTASSTTLQDRTRYPLTIQVGAIDDEFTVPSKVAFLKLMGWTKVALIFQDNQYFRQNIKNLAGALEDNDVTILTTETVKDLNNLDEQIQSLKGQVSFDDDLERNVSSYISQFQGDGFVRVAQYFPEGIHLIPDKPISWNGSYRPVDGEHETEIRVRVSGILKIVIVTLTSFGVLIALIFLVINITLRKQRAIKISSPKINNLIVCGCLLLYSSVFVSGMDTSGLNETGFIITCYVQIWLICVGFSLSFGSLLVKTYRIFAIFRKAVEKFKKIYLPDRKLMLAVGLLVLVDCVIIIVWAIFGQTVVKQVPLERKLSDTTSPDREEYIITVLYHCHSQQELFLMCALYGFKGSILVFGIFMAWETRHVKVRGLNDSKYVVLSICIVGVTVAIAIPTLYFFMENADLHFCFYGISVIFANTSVLCVVFLPKFYLWHTTRGGALRVTMMDMSESSCTTVTERNRRNELHTKHKEKLEVLTNLLKDYKNLVWRNDGLSRERRRQNSITKLSSI